MLFQPRQSPVLSVLSTVFTGSLLVALERAGVGDEMRMQIWKWTELQQMLEVTNTGSHSYVGNEALGEVCQKPVKVFLVAALPRWSAGRLSTHHWS